MLFLKISMKEKFHSLFPSWKARLLITTRRLFHIIKQKIGQKINILHWAPEKILSDFETELTSAVQTEFPNAVHWGCYFHLTQANFRKIQSSGMQIPYRRHEKLGKKS